MGEWEVLLRGIYFLDGGNLGRSDFNHSNFLKLEAAFCKYQTLIKISMTCVYNEQCTGAMTAGENVFKSIVP